MGLTFLFHVNLPWVMDILNCVACMDTQHTCTVVLKMEKKGRQRPVEM